MHLLFALSGLARREIFLTPTVDPFEWSRRGYDVMDHLHTQHRFLRGANA